MWSSESEVVVRCLLHRRVLVRTNTPKIYLPLSNDDLKLKETETGAGNINIHQWVRRNTATGCCVVSSMKRNRPL